MIKKYNNLSLQIKAAIWYTICNVLQKGISLIAVPIYTRLLTPEQYGSYSVFLSWVEIFEIIATFRLSWGGYIVGLTKYSLDRDRYSSSVQSLSITITTFFLFVYCATSDIVNAITGMTFSLTIMCFLLLYAMSGISFWMARQRVEYRYKAVITVSLISSALVPVLGVLGTFLIDQKEVAIIGARVLVQGSSALILTFMTIIKGKCFFNREYWIRSLKFNVPLLPYYLSTVLLHSSDRILIQNLVGKAQAGIYGVAYSASMVMSLFNSAINSSLQPWLFQKMKDRQYKEISGLINSMLIVVGMLNLILIAIAPEAIYIMAPKEYREALWVVPPLAGSVFVMFFYQNFINVEFFFEDSKSIAVASIGSAILNVFLNILLIPVLGYLVAGYTTLISYMVFCVLHYKFMCAVCKRHGCPTTIVNIKIMTLIMGAFFAGAGILMIGYKVLWIRYAFILLAIIISLVKRKVIYNCLKRLKNRA